MSKLMQMAELIIRGGIATQTMKNLTQQEIEEINLMVEDVMKDQSIMADKVEICRQLSNTIGGDYRSDRKTGIQEFRIAVWRAVVNLFYHRTYSYICTICGTAQYITMAGKDKQFDRQYKVCPACKQTYYKSKICKVLRSAPKEYTIEDVDNGKILKKLPLKSVNEIVSSPISAIKGEKKYENPEEIFNDPIQRRKWFKTWVWNYFKQILNENSIRTHNKHQVEVSGPADEIVASVIVNELKRLRRKFYFDSSTIHNNKTKNIEIIVSMLMTPPEFTGFLNLIRLEYEAIGVRIKIDFDGIKIKKLPPDRSEFISTTLTEEEVVMVVSSNTPSHNGPEGSENRQWADAVEFNVAGGQHYDGDLAMVDSNDFMKTIKKNLPDITKKIFEIYAQVGSAWEHFSNEWGERTACKSHIADFLQISMKEVDAHRQIIKTQCLAHNIV